MAYLAFDRSYAPCGFLIVRDGCSHRDDANTVLVQSDWDFPGVASSCGFQPCECGATDGTVDCEHKTASEMISAAYDWLSEHDGESFDALDDYFPDA